jgi:gluconokinase
MGVSGTGKTRIGSQLAQALGWEFLDGDDYHRPAEVKKMASGIPLTETDRQPWLVILRNLLLDRVQKGQDSILACSALTSDFRNKLIAGFTNISIIHLLGDYDLIKARMEERKGHYFNPDLLMSQFEALEPPEGVFTVDIAKKPDEIIEEIRGYLRR